MSPKLSIFDRHHIHGKTGVHSGKPFEQQQRPCRRAEKRAAELAGPAPRSIPPEGSSARTPRRARTRRLPPAPSAGARRPAANWPPGSRSRPASRSAPRAAPPPGPTAILRLAGSKCSRVPVFQRRRATASQAARPARGHALRLHVVERGVREIGLHQLAGFRQILQRTEEAGDPHDVARLAARGLERLAQASPAISRPAAPPGRADSPRSRPAPPRKTRPCGLTSFFAGRDGLQHHLRAFQRQSAGLNQAQRRQAAVSGR